MTDKALKTPKGQRMTSLEIIKDELARINEARAKANSSLWCYDKNAEWMREIDELPYGKWGEVICDFRTQITENKQTAQKSYSNAQFIALAANEITRLTKALSVAVSALAVYEQAHKASLESIANILSDGKDGK